MTDLASLRRVRDLSEAIYDASRSDNVDLLISLQGEREVILSRARLDNAKNAEKADVVATVRLLEEILNWNEKARALLEPWHRDMANYLAQLDENRRRFRPAGSPD